MAKSMSYAREISWCLQALVLATWTAVHPLLPSHAADIKQIDSLALAKAYVYPFSGARFGPSHEFVDEFDLSPKSRQVNLPKTDWTFENGLALDGALTYDDIHARAVMKSWESGKIIEIKDDIVSGDAKKLENLAKSIGFYNCQKANYCPFANILALNSGGGSLREALKIADLVRRYNLVTVVDAGSKCESACSLIFFSGYTDYEGFFYPRRFAHASASVGVHQPFINVVGDGFSADNMKATVRDINDTASQIAARFLSSGMSLRLLGNMYRTPPGPDSMYHLSPVELAAEGVFVYGAADTVKNLTAKAAADFCAEVYRSHFGATHSDAAKKNMAIDADAFVTYETGRDFVCMGRKDKSGDWMYSVCLNNECQLARYGQVEVAKHQGKPWFSLVDGMAVDVDNGTIGYAMNSAKPKARLQYVRIFFDDFSMFTPLRKAFLTVRPRK